jgi:hypothetical protein
VYCTAFLASGLTTSACLRSGSPLRYAGMPQSPLPETCVPQVPTDVLEPWEYVFGPNAHAQMRSWRRQFWFDNSRPVVLVQSAGLSDRHSSPAVCISRACTVTSAPKPSSLPTALDSTSVTCRHPLLASIPPSLINSWSTFLVSGANNSIADAIFWPPASCTLCASALLLRI